MAKTNNDVQSWDAANRRDIMIDVKEWVAEIEQLYGIKIEVKPGSYTNEELPITFVFRTKGLTKQVEQIKSSSIARGYAMFDIGHDPDDTLHHPRLPRGGLFKVIDYKPQRPKNCFTIKSLGNGKEYRCNQQLVKHATSMNPKKTAPAKKAPVKKTTKR